ncbi:MAG: hypothetical protein PHE21_03115 [Candidatus Dojkabacteria bacterium]|nr:hypothetical protein [Candidatus Dojkabacteria bacterium]
MIKIVQGLNLESEYSIIKIDIKKTEDVLRLLNLIKGFHPLFMHNYKFQENILIIESNISFFWREMADILISLSKEEMSFEEAKKITLEEVIKERFLSMVTIPILHLANQMGLETTPTMLEDKRLTYTKTYNRHYTIGIGKNSEILYSVSSSRDSKIGQTIQKDKWATNTLIQRMGLPIAKWRVVDNITQLKSIWGEYEKPIVVKPVGLRGGSGVSLGINSLESAIKAFNYAKKQCNKYIGKEWQTKVMIQEQVQGEDYRLLVIDGKLEVVTKRIPASVIGNGKDTIKKLIEETNKDPRRDITNPTHILKPINIDEPLLECLKEQRMTLTSIPQKNQNIYVKKVASMSQGGITEDFTNKVGPEIKLIAESIASSIHAFVLGVDILCKDISKPLTKENGGIIEINIMPEAYLNIYPVIGEQRECVYEKLIKSLIYGNKTKQIVVVGHSNEDIPTLLRKPSLFNSSLTPNDVIGEYKDGKIIINGLEINDDLEKLKAIEGLKINASLDAMIIHHRNVEDILEAGFGFNRIHLLYVKKEYLKNKEFKRTLRKYQFKGLISKIKIF